MRRVESAIAIATLLLLTMPYASEAKPPFAQAEDTGFVVGRLDCNDTVFIGAAEISIATGSDALAFDGRASGAVGIATQPMTASASTPGTCDEAFALVAAAGTGCLFSDQRSALSPVFSPTKTFLCSGSDGEVVSALAAMVAAVLTLPPVPAP